MIVDKTGEVKQASAALFQNTCSWKFLDIYRKTPVWECLFNKVAVSLSYRTPLVTAFGYSSQLQIFREITPLKFQGQHAAQFNFCRSEHLCLAIKQKSTSKLEQFFSRIILGSASEKKTGEEKGAQWSLWFQVFLLVHNFLWKERTNTFNYVIIKNNMPSPN